MSSPVTIAVYLSRAGSFNAATDVQLGTITAPALSPGATAPITATFSIAGALPTGNYFVTTVVDPAHSAADANSSDKTLTSAQPLLSISRPAVKVGGLNPSFGDNGIAKTTVSGAPFTAVDSAIQSDGKIVVAGSQLGSGFVLLRFNPDGSLDQSFGTAGVVRTTLSTSDLATSIAIQKDGKILLAGRSNGDFALLRFTSSGSPDTSFGNSGAVTTDLAPLLGAATSNDQANEVAVRTDGKIYLAGITDARGTNDFAVVRYNADGSLDPATTAERSRSTSPVDRIRPIRS